MLDKVCSLEKQLHNSARILEDLAQQIPQARFQLHTASRLETEYRNSFRSFVHKLQGKQEEESARLSREKRLAEANLNQLVQQKESEIARHEATKAQLSQLPSWESLATEENQPHWAKLELSLCAAALLPRLEELDELLSEYRRMLRGEFPVLSIEERQTISTGPIDAVTEQAAWLSRLENALTILESTEEIPQFFRNPAGFLAAAARHNQLERAAEAEDQIIRLRKLLKNHL
jgi:hypothetical protein